MTDRRPTLTREQHLTLFAKQYPFAELAVLGFGRCVIAERFKKRRPDGSWIRVVTLSDVWERAITLDVDEHGAVHGHITAVVGDDQPVLVAETPSAALQLVAAAPGTPTEELLRIPDITTARG